MIVAMIAMRMMQMSVDQIVDMVTMGNRLVAAARPMDMPRVMAATFMIRSATIRIVFRNFNKMLVNMIPMGMMQMSIMQVIDVAVMADCDMAATGTVLVVVIGVVW